MPDRVLGPGATGTGKKADQTDPAPDESKPASKRKSSHDEDES